MTSEAIFPFWTFHMAWNMLQESKRGVILHDSGNQIYLLRVERKLAFA